MPTKAASQSIEVRPYSAEDRQFLASIAHRLHPGESVSPRDPEVVARFFASLAEGRMLSEPGSEAFVAVVGGTPAGVVALHPDADYFTGHSRAYVDVLVVAAEAEGKGIGRALMRHVEDWARAHNCLEVVLDVFAGNAGAIAFYERNGYRPDHVRMAKPLV
jgi:GNAT superfamily N-acetyltransferase